MRKFIINIISFIIITTICFFILWIILCYNRNEVLTLPEDVNIVFLGNSHIECDINDSIITNSYNFAQSNDYPEQVYCKVKLLKRSNPHLDTIVVGYDNVIMEQDLSNEIPGTYSPYYYDQYSIEDISNIIAHSSFKYCVSHFYTPFKFSQIEHILPSSANKSINITNLKNLGGYEYLVRDKLQQHITLQKDKKAHKSSFDFLSKYFLNKTIDFCKANNMTIILLATPQHHMSKIDTLTYKQYHQQNYKDLKFYDFRSLQLPDSCFGDLNHLNHKGAKIFSNFLEKEVIHKNKYKKQP